jgi:hypothetical protein
LKFRKKFTGKSLAFDDTTQQQSYDVPVDTYDAKKAQDPDDDQALIGLAKKRFQNSVEAESECRKNELDDIKFMAGDQWPMDIRHARQEDQRPCLTVNMLPKFVHQITNEQRQNRPGIKVNPADNRGDKETAKVLEGLIRHIEYNSHADFAYDRALEGAATSGRGYFRVMTQYSDPISFQQEIIISSIRDSMSVYLDPFYQEPDGSDAQYGFIFAETSKDEFRSQYPDAKLSLMADWTSIGDGNGLFIKKDSVRVAEYYYKVWEKATICLLSNQKTIQKKDLPKTLPDDVRVVSERETIIPKIKWAKITGMEVLDRAEVLGHWVPIIPVLGNDMIVDGKRVVSGLIRDAKDSQRMYNYWASAQTEMVALAPKSPFIVAEGQIEDYEQIWKTSNTKNHAYMPYKPTSIAGVQVPPPQRTQFEPQIQSITMSRQQSAQELKDITGMYDANIGNRSSNANTGVAIQRQISQGQTTNFHYIDNLGRSLRHLGRILINWIPAVYKAQQAARIIGDDGEVKFVDINRVIDGYGTGIKAHFLDEGRYDCTVSVGPSYQTRRTEAVASMLDLARSMPQAMGGSLDILVGNMDWPGAQQIADRIKRGLPPQLTQEGPPQFDGLPPNIKTLLGQQQATLAQQSQIISQLSTAMQQKKLELDSKERIETMKQRTDLTIEYLRARGKAAETVFEAEIGMIDRRLNMVGENEPIGAQFGLAGQPGMPQGGPQQMAPPQGPPGMPPQSGMPPQMPNMPTGGQPSPGQSMGGQ